jgi:hypothetical protein
MGELRSQLYRAFDRNHITKEEFELFIKTNIDKKTAFNIPNNYWK